jgi:hypothetical protein
MACSSTVKTRVDEYKAKKSGRISQAHYTYYGYYFEKANQVNGMEPKFYNGHFLIKEFHETLRPLSHKFVHPEVQYTNIEDYFNINGVPDA